MRRFFLAAAISGALIASAAGTALAGSDNHTELGTPGEPNCVGQTTAYLAQVGPTFDLPTGLGRLADALGISVKEYKAIIQEYCDS